MESSRKSSRLIQSAERDKGQKQEPKFLKGADMKRIYVEESLCNGCRRCELICSFLQTGDEYNPRHSRIKILKVEEEGLDIPIVDCDGERCREESGGGEPACVKHCLPGALIFAERDQVLTMRRRQLAEKAKNPEFKVRGYWVGR